METQDLELSQTTTETTTPTLQAEKNINPEKTKTVDNIIHSEKTGFSESKIRHEYVYLKLFHQMGIPVPECHFLMDDDNRPVLEISPTKLINLSSLSFEDGSEIKKQIDHIQTVSLVLGDTKKFVNTGVTTEHDATILSALHDFTLLGENDTKAVRKLLENDDVPASKFSETLNQLTPESVLATVQSSGLSDNESREIIGGILRNKDKLLKLVPHEENNEIDLFTTEDAEKIDKLLDGAEGNKKYDTVSLASVNILDKVSTIKRLEIASEPSNAQQNSNIKFSEIEEQMTSLKDIRDDNEKATRLIEIQRSIDEKKNGIMGMLNSRRINGLLSKTLLIKKELIEGLYYQIGEQAKYLDHTLSITLGHQQGNHNKLESYLTPSHSQLTKLNELSDQLQQLSRVNTSNHEKIHACLNTISHYQNRHETFLRFCQERSRSLISHLSQHEGIRNALSNGYLESSLRQQEKGKKPFVNSPAGGREILPQLTFAVNGADIGYGGTANIPHRGAANTELSAGFVGSYPEIAAGQNIDEFSTHHIMYDAELHIFNPEHSVSHQSGVEISLDKFFLLVPEKEKQKWVEHISTEGYDKSPAWIEKHLKTYPAQLTIDVYLKYFARHEDFSFTDQKGIFVDNAEKISLHQDWTDSAYKWINL